MLLIHEKTFALSFVPFLLSAFSAFVIVGKYAKRVSCAWSCLLLFSWLLLQAAGCVGLTLAFDESMSALVVLLGALWLCVAFALLLRMYVIGITLSVCVLGAHMFAASHALHIGGDYALLATLFDLAAAMWAVITTCFCFSLLLHNSALQSRLRALRRVQQPQTSNETPNVSELPTRALQHTANIFVRQFRAAADGAHAAQKTR